TGVVHRGQHSRRHLLLVHAEPAMNRANDEVEPAEGGLVVVQAAGRENVSLDSFQDAKSLQTLVHGVDLVCLALEIVSSEATGVGWRLARVRDSEVLVPGILAGCGHLHDGIRSIRVVAVAMQKAFQVALLQKRGKRILRGSLDLSASFTDLRWNLRQPQS